jgi:hypothetical protein
MWVTFLTNITTITNSINGAARIKSTIFKNEVYTFSDSLMHPETLQAERWQKLRVVRPVTETISPLTLIFYKFPIKDRNPRPADACTKARFFSGQSRMRILKPLKPSFSPHK